VYFILSGAVAVDDGRELRLVGTDRAVGLVAAFTGSAPIVTIEATDATVLFVVGRRQLFGMTQDNPPLLASLAKHLASHSTEL
jgi:hypothetical protein